jgi:hypothetical protein
LLFTYFLARVAQLRPAREIVTIWLIWAFLAEGQLSWAGRSLVYSYEVLDECLLEVEPLVDL